MESARLRPAAPSGRRGFCFGACACPRRIEPEPFQAAGAAAYRGAPGST